MPLFWNELPFSGRLYEFADVENVFSSVAERVCKGRCMSLLMRQLLLSVASDGRLPDVFRVERLCGFLGGFAALASV